MADDTDTTGASSDAPQPADAEVPELTPEATGRGWPPSPAVIVVIGFIVAVVAVVLIARATGGDSIDSATDTIVGDAADEPADQPADDADGDSSSRSSDESSSDDVASADASVESPMFGGGGDWLVPWKDGFLRFGLVFAPQLLPEFDGRFDDLFGPEVVETLEAAGATTIDEATDVLLEAGLYDLGLDAVHALALADVGGPGGDDDIGRRQHLAAEDHRLLGQLVTHRIGTDAGTLVAHDAAAAEPEGQHVGHAEVGAHAADLDRV